MSHNSNKVNAQEPNRQGEITQALNDLSDVNASSPSSGQMLIYSSGAWGAGAGAATGGIINIGQGESDAYSNSGASSIATNVDLFFYDSAPTNSISGATINNVGVTDWVSSVELPIGDYMIWVRFGAEFSSTGYLGFAVYDSGNVVKSTYAMIGANTTAYHFPPSVLQARVNLTAITTLKIRGFHSSGVDTVANQANTPAEYSQWTIVKI